MALTLAAQRVLQTVRLASLSSPDHQELLSRRPDSDARGLDRPPLLFVHGAYHGAWCWDQHWMPEAATRGWRCFAVSLRGHGGSGGTGRRHRWRLVHYERDVVRAVDEFDQPPVLVAHSMGATVVQRLLADRRLPDTPATALVAPLPLHGSYRLPLRVARRHPMDALRLGLLQPLPPRPDYFFSDRLDAATAEDYTQRLEPESVLAQLELARPRRTPATARIDTPLLVLGGEDDALVDPVAVIKTAKAYGTRARLFRAMGHDLMLDAGWRAPLEVLLRWLEDEALS